MTPKLFSQTVLKWFKLHGRHDLPWQKNATPYRVWVSEIMLQQTQVATVIDYYQRFMKRFPSLKALATAPGDDVLAHWSGLGYYARARNLHKTAKIIFDEHNSRFPKTITELEKLPGIGRSTAGAILSLSMNIPAPILDGNVKRVLTRFAAISGWPGNTDVLKKLWALSESLTPNSACKDYNQAMMDLGATLCTRTKPDCHRCPLKNNCQAHLSGEEEHYPSKKPKKSRPQKSTTMLILKNESGEILFEKRPPSGIWGGLWSFPELTATQSKDETLSHCKNKFLCNVVDITSLSKFSHQFSHFELSIHAKMITVKSSPNVIMDSSNQVWYNQSDKLPGGIAAPVAKLLKKLHEMR